MALPNEVHTSLISFISRPEHKPIFHCKLKFEISPIKLGYQMQLSFVYGSHVARSVFIKSYKISDTFWNVPLGDKAMAI